MKIKKNKSSHFVSLFENCHRNFVSDQPQIVVLTVTDLREGIKTKYENIGWVFFFKDSFPVCLFNIEVEVMLASALACSLATL